MAIAMNNTIRSATVADVVNMVQLSEQKRIEYQTYQPVFWCKAHDSAAKQQPYLESLLHNPEIIALVSAEAGALAGFVLASVRGGQQCSIDDFCVADATTWSTVGRALLETAGTAAKARSVTIYEVVCGHLDQPKRAMLQAAGLQVDRNWFTRPIRPRLAQVEEYTVRPAIVADVPHMSQLAGGRRTDYPEIERAELVTRVCVTASGVQGYVIGRLVPAPPVYDPGGLTALVLELVAAAGDYRAVGSALLHELEKTTQQQGAVQVVAICPQRDQAQGNLLFALGYTIASEWYTGVIG